MDYIEGKDLETILDEEGTPGLPEVLLINWAEQVLDVLIYLHSQNPPIIYRDLKPANIMFRNKDNRIFLIDFGIARTVTEDIQAQTVIGTQGYSPPEQYKGKGEIRSDIYALGATLHHLISGMKPLIPFQFEPVKDIAPHISDRFASIIIKALSMKLSERFSSATEMKMALLGEKHIPLSLQSGAEKFESDLNKEIPGPLTSDFVDSLSQDVMLSVNKVSSNEIKGESNVSLPDIREKKKSKKCVLPELNEREIFGSSLKGEITKPLDVSSVRQVTEITVIPSEEEKRENMIFVKGGETVLGSKESLGFLGSRWQVIPVYKVYLKDFYIDKYPVTYEEYDNFIKTTSYTSQGEWQKYYTFSDRKHPVINITWNDAYNYAVWKGKTLPTQVEWEKASRGQDFRSYPWGKDWDSNKCNNLRMDRSDLVSNMLNIKNGRGTIPVGIIPEGSSPYGVMDMAGQVWEWCFDWYYKPKGVVVDPMGPSGGTFKTLCGGSWSLKDQYCFWCSIRTKEKPESYSDEIGFRCIKRI